MEVGIGTNQLFGTDQLFGTETIRIENNIKVRASLRRCGMRVGEG